MEQRYVMDRMMYVEREESVHHFVYVFKILFQDLVVINFENIFMTIHDIELD